jgi:hypothetical protein
MVITIGLASLLMAATAQIQPGIKWSPAAMGQQSQVRQSQVVRLRSERELEAYWHQNLGRQGTAMPEIDFREYDAVMVHLGQRSTGGYRFFVRSVTEGPRGETVVRALETRPAAGSFVAQVVTSPWALIRVKNDRSRYTLAIETRDSVGSSSPGDFEPIPPRPIGEPVKWNILASGQFCATDGQRVQLIRSSGDMETYWARVMRRPAATAPQDVNWAEWNVAAVHLGSRRTGGTQFRVQGVFRTARGDVVVQAVEIPPTAEYVPPGSTSPWVLIRVDARVTRLDLLVERPNERRW